MIKPSADTGNVGRMRLVKHPGAVTTYRKLLVPVETDAPVRIELGHGQDLYQSIHRELEDRQSVAGAFRLISGTVERLSLMTGGPGEGETPIRFHGPHDLAAPLSVVSGAAGIGVDEQGARFTHCHATFRDRDGHLVGGHLLPGDTFAGKDGIVLDLVVIRGGRFARQEDPETLFTCFHPEPV